MKWFRIWKSQGRSVDINDPVRVRMKESKKVFMKCLRKLSKQYERSEIDEVIRTAEFDRNAFWRIWKRKRKGRSENAFALKNKAGKVSHDINEILEIWRQHFADLSTLKNEPHYDNNHYVNVTKHVKDIFNSEKLDNKFLEVPFSSKEMYDAISGLHNNKAPGCDKVTAEHLKYGGNLLVDVLTLVYNMCFEYC